MHMHAFCKGCSSMHRPQICIPLMLLASGAASARTAASTATSARHANSIAGKNIPACSEIRQNPNVPVAAFNVFGFLISHNYSPPPGYKGNSIYENRTHKLPDPPKGWHWYEYRTTKGPGTGQRLVTLRDGKAVGGGYPYYSPEHYNDFTPMFLCSSVARSRRSNLVPHGLASVDPSRS